MDSVTRDFVVALPKIELHAHLSGSISRECLQLIWEDRRNRKITTTEKSPAEAMLAGKYDVDINSFFPLFSNYIYALVNDEASIRQSTISVLHDFATDGVVYLELRTTPRAIPTAGISKDRYIQIVLDCITNHSPQNMIARLILSVDRSNTSEQAIETISLAIKYQSQGVVGVDLCGNPAKGDVRIYRDAFTKAKEQGLGITLHFAEVSASSTDEELSTLLSFEPDRLGHVIHVNNEFKKEILHRKLGLELCLSCNVLAKMTQGGFPEHHFAEWRHTACPIALSTDDVGVFGSCLSNEYLLAAQHFALTQSDLVDLAAQAIDSIFSHEHKSILHGLFSVFRRPLQKSK